MCRNCDLAEPDPSKDWLKFVVTQRAKSKIRQWTRAEERAKGIELGTRLLEDELRRHGLPISATLKSEKMEEVVKAYTLQSLEDHFCPDRYGKVSAHQIVNRFMPERGHEEAQQAARPAKPARSPRAVPSKSPASTTFCIDSGNAACRCLATRSLDLLPGGRA